MSIMKKLLLLPLLVCGVIGSVAAQEPRTDSLPSEAERVYALARYWRDAGENFVYFDHVPGLNWDSAYTAFVPKVLAAQNTWDYFRVLQQFAALLHDGHSDVILPFPAIYRYVDRPWIALREVQRRAIVENVDTTLAALVPIGSEVVAVDGTPTEERLRTQVLPFVSSSTEAVRWEEAIVGDPFRGYGLLYGQRGSAVRLTLRTPQGRTREVALFRDAMTRYSSWLRAPAASPLMEMRWLPGGIAYVALNSFANDSIDRTFERALPELARARALIIDLRNNGGGNTDIGTAILAHLTADTLVGSAWRARENVSAYRAWAPYLPKYKEYGTGNAWLSFAPDTLAPAPAAARVLVPTAVLIGPHTGSATEDFLVNADRLKPRVFLVGEPSSGSTGQPLSMRLPGGLQARVCAKRNTYPDGRDFVGVGVQPDVLVPLTTDDVRAGRDAVLERAQLLLRDRLAALPTARR